MTFTTPSSEAGFWREETPIVLPPRPRLTLSQKARWHWQRLTHRKAVSEQFPYPHVRLAYWRPEGRSARVNFGDELARVVVELMLARRGATLFDSAPADRLLVTVGSTLHTATDKSTIWGTGVHGLVAATEHRYTDLDVRAVRGPITARFLRSRGIGVPSVFGDPGLLVPALTQGRFRPDRGSKTIGFVPNFNDLPHLDRIGFRARFPQVELIDPLRSWDAVIGDIVKCGYVMASSLHGLVIADAYGIPARYVRLTEHEALLKYQDYYGGTGRDLSYVRTVEDAIELGGAAPFAYDPAALMASFPYDLWGL